MFNEDLSGDSSQNESQPEKDSSDEEFAPAAKPIVSNKHLEESSESEVEELVKLVKKESKEKKAKSGKAPT